ncbi:MAG: hypothetical protein ACE5GI_09215 [Candidatus Aminicenantales bacterium]
MKIESETQVDNTAGWRHSGFSVHNKVKASTKQEAEKVGKYMIRPLLSHALCFPTMLEWKNRHKKAHLAVTSKTKFFYEVIEGIPMVKNPEEPMYGEDVFILEEELSIGEAAGKEEYMFSEIQAIVVDDEGRIEDEVFLRAPMAVFSAGA